MKPYTSTRVWAHVMIAVGAAIFGLTTFLALVFAFVEIPPLVPNWPRPTVGARTVGSVLFLLVGFLLAAPFIVTGQLVLVFLDMRTRLQRIDRRSRRPRLPSPQRRHARTAAPPPIARRLDRARSSTGMARHGFAIALTRHGNVGTPWQTLFCSESRR